MKRTLGTDIGRVILSGDTDFAGQSVFSESFLDTPEIEGASDSLRLLWHNSRFQGRIHLVSKCGERVQARTCALLDHRRFFECTGIPREGHLHFCRKRPEKGPICKRLGVTDFVDDRPDVLAYMSGIVPYRYLFRPTKDDLDRYGHWLTNEKIVWSWKELLVHLLGGA